MAAERQAPDSQAPKCQVQALTKRYGSRAAVENVSFDIAEGEFVVLLGPSGCGKTTTLRLVAGLAKPDEGRISLGGKPVSDAALNLFVRPERRDIGMVFPILCDLAAYERLREHRLPAARPQARSRRDQGEG